MIGIDEQERLRGGKRLLALHDKRPLALGFVKLQAEETRQEFALEERRVKGVSGCHAEQGTARLPDGQLGGRRPGFGHGAACFAAIPRHAGLPVARVRGPREVRKHS